MRKKEKKNKNIKKVKKKIPNEQTKKSFHISLLTLMHDHRIHRLNGNNFPFLISHLSIFHLPHVCVNISFTPAIISLLDEPNKKYVSHCKSSKIGFCVMCVCVCVSATILWFPIQFIKRRMACIFTIHILYFSFI